jgi:hypothetical protein
MINSCRQFGAKLPEKGGAMKTAKDMALMYKTVLDFGNITYEPNDPVERAELTGWLNCIKYVLDSDAEYKVFTDELARLRKAK